jgi:hypothetical protein
LYAIPLTKIPTGYSTIPVCPDSCWKEISESPFEIHDRDDGEPAMKRCAQGDLTGILDFYQLVINETEDMPVHARRV